MKYRRKNSPDPTESLTTPKGQRNRLFAGDVSSVWAPSRRWYLFAARFLIGAAGGSITLPSSSTPNESPAADSSNSKTETNPASNKREVKVYTNS